MFPRSIDATQFVTTADLAADTLALCSHLPPEVDAVVGSARSGLIPAATIAAMLHVPLYSVSRLGIRDVGHGRRMDRFTAQGIPIPVAAPSPRMVLCVEDSCYLGIGLRIARNWAKAKWPDAETITASVYSTANGAAACDLYAALYPEPHFFEWNFANSMVHKFSAVDFDGILCDNCPAECDDDGPRYLNWLRTVRPKHLFRRKPIRRIVTGRSAKYRGLTEAWLIQWGIAWDELCMGPWPSQADRSGPGEIARFKAEQLRNSDCLLMVESDPRQAVQIVEQAGKPVLCPALGRLLLPDGVPIESIMWWDKGQTL